MEAVQKDREWSTRSVLDGRPVARPPAPAISGGRSPTPRGSGGDPGLQFDTTVNAWHTSAGRPASTPSNPCSEYMYLDDSACNLASLNLLKFVGGAGDIDVESFKRAVELTILAQEIIVGNAKYPTKRIEENSPRFRPLGLGYANLGALLMSRGLPYDSAGARAYAGAVTAAHDRLGLSRKRGHRARLSPDHSPATRRTRSRSWA